MPAEIRNIMYDQLFGERQVQRRDPNELAMFSVSKQLHQETSSYFYQHNNIAIHAPSTSTDCATILPPITDKYQRYLKRLTLYVATGHPTLVRTLKVASTIAALAAIGAELSELNLAVTSPFSDLLHSRVDDSVMAEKHPITSAISQILESRVAKVVRIELHNTHFAPGVASTLQYRFGSHLEFYIDGSLVHDVSKLERALTGRFSSTHLTRLGLDEEDVRGIDFSDASSPISSPSSLPSSLCSAFSDLDTFSVSSFELSSDESEEDAASKNDTDTDEQPFFSQDDIEEWSADTQGIEDGDSPELSGADDVNDDEEMEDVDRSEIEDIMSNMQEVAHHVANGEDITYMTNFAPDLLLSRHHLGHLV